MLDPYASCPCGSGKKFKWCCQPIHAEIDRALRQDAEGQHEAALQLLEQVARDHPANPEALGRLAQFRYNSGKVEEAENTLQKAFDISPHYPFGHLLRGLFRHHEGEMPGALLLFRKAAEYYDPEALDALGQVYMLIADCEMKLNRPVAARAALQIALHCDPGNDELRKNFDTAFGDKSLLPTAARREYTFLPPASTVAGNRRTAWDRVLGSTRPRLSDTVRVFEQLTTEDDGDAAAWYNLGVARAWLGDNSRAIEALGRYVELEPDESRAGAAWTLAEVLRLGFGLEEQADCREFSVAYQVRDPNPLFALLQQWEQDRRLVGVQASQEEGVLSALVLEKPPVLAAGAATGTPQRVAAYLLLVGPLLRLRHPIKESLDRVCAEVQQRAAPALTPGLEKVSPASFTDVVLEAVAFPVGAKDQALAEQSARAHAARFFEETWLHRPLRSLSGVPPVDSAGHRTLRKKLIGVVDFLQQCAAGGIVQTYDFDHLRRKLGLLGAAPTAAAAPAAPEGAAAVGDIRAMGAAELAQLPNELSEEQLADAYQAATRLDAQDLAERFARALVAQPPDRGRPDRGPWYLFLIQRALAAGNADTALHLIDEGEGADKARNEGRRRNDYDLRRAQVHLKRGEADQAQGVYDRLLEREPSNLRLRGSAAEGLLSQRQGARALRIAEEGLARARQQNDRDSEQYFLELVAAARKQVG
jgi:tetratricopeptide (TPR) repeat protein